MEFVDYKCLESLLIEGEEIATEAVSDTGIIKIFTKVNSIRKSVSSKSYSSIADFVELANTPENLSNKDIKLIHDYFYNETEAIKFFGIDDSTGIKQVKELQPVPIYANDMGDFMCITKSGKITEFIHDTTPHFNSKYGKVFNSYSEFISNFIQKSSENNKNMINNLNKNEIINMINEASEKAYNTLKIGMNDKTKKINMLWADFFKYNKSFPTVSKVEFNSGYQQIFLSFKGESIINESLLRSYQEYVARYLNENDTLKSFGCNFFTKKCLGIFCNIQFD